VLVFADQVFGNLDAHTRLWTLQAAKDVASESAAKRGLEPELTPVRSIRQGQDSSDGVCAEASADEATSSGVGRRSLSLRPLGQQPEAPSPSDPSDTTTALCVTPVIEEV
jgi:hypothetical protein